MITEIRDRTKLQSMLRDSIRDRDYYFNCIDEVGRILEKHTFSWDGKPKNLDIYVSELIKKYETLQKCLQEIKAILEDVKVYDPLAKKILDLITKAEEEWISG